MTSSLVSQFAVALLTLSLGALAMFCVHALRRVVPQRIARLEEALRVYNTANATLGRQLAELEATVARLREGQATRPVAAEEARPAPSAAQRYGIRPTPAEAGAEFSEAELRLAQLIKSRLSSLRLN